MQINHSSPLPLHVQVEKLIREMLQEKRYQDGELFPPEALMAEKLAVSRNTVRAAISRLVQEGLLERKAGLGTRYVKQTVKTNLQGWPSFTLEMKKKGIKVEVFSLQTSYVVACDDTSAALRLPKAKNQARILKMDRVRGHEGIPAVYSISWFHPRTKITPEEDFSMPLYDLIHEKSGVSVIFSEEEISAACADEELAEKLHCEIGDPVLLRKRIVKDASKREVEYNINYYRADRFIYGLTIQAE